MLTSVMFRLHLFYTLLELTIVKETKKQQLYLENYINVICGITELLHNFFPMHAVTCSWWVNKVQILQAAYISGIVRHADYGGELCT